MDSEGTNGEYIVMDSCDVYIVMYSEVKLFMITEGVFLCVGDVHIEVFYGMELNDLLHCGTEGRYVNGRMDTGLDIAGTGQRWLDLKLRMKPCLVGRLLETLVSTFGVLVQVTNGKSEGELADGSSVDGGCGRELVTTTRLIYVVKRPQMVFRCWRKRCALVK